MFSSYVHMYVYDVLGHDVHFDTDGYDYIASASYRVVLKSTVLMCS